MAVRERVRGAGATGANKLSVLREIGLLAIEDMLYQETPPP